MKNAIATMIVVLASSAAFAGPARSAPVRVESLECKATNGVFIKTQEITREGNLLVRSQWGVYTKSFFAKLLQVTVENKALITLAEKGEAPKYALELAVDPALTNHQVVSGWILRPNPMTGAAPIPVTRVRCDLQFAL